MPQNAQIHFHPDPPTMELAFIDLIATNLYLPLREPSFQLYLMKEALYDVVI